MGCTGSRCAELIYLDLEDYTRRVLAAEWPGSAIQRNVADALKAGAIAVRSYGLAYTSQTYICSTQACQVLNGRTFVETDAAVRATKGIVLADGLAVARAEYAAETNNMGCGDGYSGEKSASSPCIGDAVCKGRKGYGHGRGMCQNGSVAWASGKTDQEPRDWQWILHHYYPRYKLIPSRCDLNNDFKIDTNDVNMAISMALGAIPCTAEADLDNNGACNVVDVQRIINATIASDSCFDAVDVTTVGAVGTPVKRP